MQGSKLLIQSDFKDYYDMYSDESGIIYRRNLGDCKSRGEALKYLRKLGIKTLELKQVSDFSYLDDRLVVYTNPKKHKGQGKILCSYNEAVLAYNNYLASKYVSSTRGVTVKYVQVGKKRFTLTFKKDTDDLSIGKLVNVVQSTDGYNRIIGLPIFSIDYIEMNSEMVATDFNEVQSLYDIGIADILKPEQVCEEIVDSLIVYNKAERNK